MAQCTRMGKPCDYQSDPSRQPSDDIALLRKRVQELEKRLNEDSSQSDVSTGSLYDDHPAGNCTFPSVYFLDSDSFTELPSSGVNHALPLPLDILVLLGKSSDVESLCTHYLATVHTWLPVISPKRLVFKGWKAAILQRMQTLVSF